MLTESRYREALIPLESLVETDALPPDRAIAFTDSGMIDWAGLQSRIAAGLETLEPLDSRCLLVRAEAGHELLACVLAAWRANRVPVLGADSLVNTAPVIDSRAATSRPEAGPVAEIPVPKVGADTAIVLFTSGSSGSPAVAMKSFRQLNAEIELLESCWGNQVKASVFASTVSRRHMYGLPFSLLWPLARGNAFYAHTIHYIQSLEVLCRRFPLTLVSSPVQLDNLPDNLDWQTLRARMAAIFSAGAPLPMQAATKCREKLVPVIEIYGSTETGVVARRDQTTDACWHCLPGITVTGDNGQLRVDSPLLENSPMTVADRAEIHGSQRFLLRGRADRIAKVGGKRISLADVEKRLLSHPWVKGARALHLPGRKSRIGAVVVLNATGRAVLIDRERIDVNRILADHISPGLESVAVPRYWRYVGRLPQTPQGKVTEPLLESLFHPERQPRLPEVLDTRPPGDSGRATLLLRIPDNLFYFTDHFPGNPVLPGVAQIAWAQHFAAGFFSGLRGFRRVERLKFQQIIQPGDVVTLALSWEPDKYRLQFCFSSPAAQHSSGRLVYAENRG